MDILGLGFLRNDLWLVALLVLTSGGYYLFSRIKYNQAQASKVHAQMQRLNWFLPENSSELKHVIFLSFIAGVCEEVVFRGFLYWFLSGMMPWWLAMVLANIPFALAHLTTTGVRNTIGTFCLAMLFSGAYLLIGSLWLSIVLHIFIQG